MQAEFHLAALFSGAWHCACWFTEHVTKVEPSLMSLETPVLFVKQQVFISAVEKSCTLTLRQHTVHMKIMMIKV